MHLAVSCCCLCPTWRDQEPLHLQTPHFIIGTQRTPRAHDLENFITQGPAMTSLWNAHRPGPHADLVQHTLLFVCTHHTHRSPPASFALGTWMFG